MYVDLVRSYLLDFGSRRSLARALGVKESFVTYLLTPFGARSPHGGLLPAKTPSQVKAERLVTLLCADVERRAVLLRHITAAREHAPARTLWQGPTLEPGRGPLASLAEVVRLQERLRAVAAGGPSPARARAAYLGLWRHGQAALDRFPAVTDPLAYTQLLLYLHEAACVLDRADLALDYARQAQLVLRQAYLAHDRQDAGTWLLAGAARAEVVALNNLGLVEAAQQCALHVEQKVLAGELVRASWLPHLYRDRLTSLRKLHRFAVSEAEILYDRAGALLKGADRAAAVLLDERHAGALLAHGTQRSLRKAEPLVERAVQAVSAGSGRENAPQLGALHRAQVWRTAARFAWQTGDRARWAVCLRRCLRMVAGAGLAHQRRQLERQYGADVIARLTGSAGA
jgi:hypothetical protein